MRSLEKNLRNELERTVKDARETAEAAARAALEQLGVGEPNPFPYLSGDEKDVRRRLRVHGRNLGDALSLDKTQEIDRLVEEAAYEHWHRMLFARFLAENDLLMHSDGLVAVTLEECADLAADEGAKNGWDLAARYAARMLPQIFRPDSPVFALDLPPEHQQKLERLVQGLPREVFCASDSLGWVYQFWQAKRKDEVNRSGVKIGARELPAVTQLFTEPYMVSFLLDNSLGAWWGARRLSDADLTTAQSEEELRQKAALPGVPLDYLRFVRGEDGQWAPAAGTFDAWPERLSELKTLDPCCGSGHFLVAAFLMLVPMRMELEGLSAQKAVDAVLKENLNGLEIDSRCVELAAFALALTAWRYPGAGGYRSLPEMNLACSGLPISAKKEEWLKLAKGDGNLEFALDVLYDQFANAPVLGSLIDPTAGLGKGTLYDKPWAEVAPLLARALKGEKDNERAEMGVVAQGLAKAAGLMAGKYWWVITNVPYLGREKQNNNLRDYGDRYSKKASSDLAVLMLERIFGYLEEDGSVSAVLPQNWWVGQAYSEYRKEIIDSIRWIYSIVLGEEAWETFGKRGPNTILVTYSKSLPRKDSKFWALDLSSKPKMPIITREIKSEALKGNSIREYSGLENLFFICQVEQSNNPDHRISLYPLKSTSLLSEYVISGEGCSTGDADRFICKFWEQTWGNGWIRFLSPDSFSRPWGGRELVMLWDNGKGTLSKSNQARIQNTELWNYTGVLVGRVRGITTTLFDGGAFSKGGVLICPKKPEDLNKVYTFLKSEAYEKGLRSLDPRVSASTSVLTKVAFNLATFESFNLPEKTSCDPTQWIFHGHPCGSVVWNDETKMLADGPLRTDATVLQVAVARLLGYRWPAELDSHMDLAALQREWVRRCDALLPFADEDGIVCIPPVGGEAPAVDRLYRLFAAAYGDAWSTATLNALLKEVGYDGKGLEAWLRESFFAEHCKLFQNRPFIWHIWDGLNDGFAALVNYHTLNHKNLEALTYTYLGDWITRQTQDIAAGVDGSVEKLDAATRLQEKLKQILEGEAPYDIFVRWKPLDEQPIGWDPDLNDGVRLNIRPFMSVKDVKKKGAGILREKPNIKWDKDRGKDVESAPWYNLGLQYGGKEGDRINDHHLSLAEKKKAREEKN